MRFLYLVLGALTAGLITGKAFSPDFGNLYELMLYTLIFFIGIDLGMSSMEGIKRVGRFVLLLPLSTMLGSLLGGVLASLILGISLRWGLAIAAGCGWYSLTGPLIAQYSAVYGALGFLANLTREIMTVILYPLASGKMQREPLVSIGGATTMDTTLPIIRKFGDSETAVVAFVHGFILTAAIPFIIPLILQLFP
ncbi:lysine exporter LysO family protein [Thermococcus atlanticus]